MEKNGKDKAKKKKWKRKKKQDGVRREELHANEIWMSWREAEPAVFVPRLSRDKQQESESQSSR